MAWHDPNSLTMDRLPRLAKAVLHNRLQVVEVGAMEGILVTFLITKNKIIFGDNFLDNNFILLIFDVDSRVAKFNT